MGSGTLCAVAGMLNRKYIGADINLGAVQVTTKRLLGLQNNNNFEVYNVNNYDFFRNPVEAKELIIDALGIQKFDSSTVYDGELDGWMVKIMPTNRIATKADLEELKANLPYHTFEKRKEESSCSNDAFKSASCPMQIILIFSTTPFGFYPMNLLQKLSMQKESGILYIPDTNSSFVGISQIVGLIV